MRQRLTDIEVALLRIDSGTFQRLSDEYLFCRYGVDFRHIIRTGTQKGKMQSVKGTPDTYVVLPNGQYVLIEYTKQQGELLKKLESDIVKCLKYAKKIGLSNTDIHRIILVHAGKKLDLKADNQLRVNCPTDLEIIGLDELALSIHNDFRQLARRYLDIPYDSLQLQTPDEFVAEQGRKSIGKNNPLSNPLRNRAEDLFALLSKISSQDITVLTGGQGVGKTRLALEAVKSFCLNNRGYEPVCVSHKDVSLIEDLNDLVRPNRKYIFLRVRFG